MATSSKPTPSAASLLGAALLVVVVAVAFLAGSCTVQAEGVVPAVVVSNLTVKNDLETTINVTTTTNLTVAGVPLVVNSVSALIGPGQSIQAPVNLAMNALPGEFSIIFRIDNRLYNVTPDVEDILLGDSGDVTGEVTATVSSPCPRGSPRPPAIYIVVTTPTGLGDTAICLEPIST